MRQQCRGPAAFAVNVPKMHLQHIVQPINIAAKQHMISRAVLRSLATLLARYRQGGRHTRGEEEEEEEKLEETEEMLDDGVD